MLRSYDVPPKLGHPLNIALRIEANGENECVGVNRNRKETTIKLSIGTIADTFPQRPPSSVTSLQSVWTTQMDDRLASDSSSRLSAWRATTQHSGREQHQLLTT